MMTDNLFEFLDEIQKLALKTKVQNILDMLVKDAEFMISLTQMW